MDAQRVTPAVSPSPSRVGVPARLLTLLLAGCAYQPGIVIPPERVVVQTGAHAAAVVCEGRDCSLR